MNPLDDLFRAGGFADTPLGRAARAAERDAKRKTSGGPLPQIRGKRIDGVLYVNAEDVAEALEAQAPRPNRRLIAKLRGAR